MIELIGTQVQGKIKALLHRAAPLLLRAGCAVAAGLLAGTQLAGGIAPFGVALCAALPAALLPFAAAGGVAGSLFFLPVSVSGQHAGACLATCCLRAALKAFKQEHHMTALAASGGAVSLLVAQSIVRIRIGGSVESSMFALVEAALILAAAHLAQQLVQRRGQASSTALLCWSMAALASLAQFWIFSVNLALVMLCCVLCCLSEGARERAFAAALAGGVILCMASPIFAPFALCAAAGTLGACGATQRGRSAEAAAYLAASCCGLLLAGRGLSALALFVNNTLGAVVFLLLPQATVTAIAGGGQRINSSPAASCAAQLRRLGDALWAVGDTVNEVCDSLPKAPRGELSDYVAQTLCQNCRENCVCWVEHAAELYDGLNAMGDGLLCGGTVVLKTLPPQIDALCKKPKQFCGAVNDYFAERMALRCARAKTGALRAAVTGQLCAVSSALCELAVSIALPVRSTARYDLEIGTAKDAAQDISADIVRSFFDQQGRGYLVLCDGMGVGQAAAVDGTMAASLARQLLEAGFGAKAAAQLVNMALSLPTGEAGATLDVLTFDLFQGVCEVYKAGAAPTYFVRGGRVGCLSAQTLPLGVLNEVRASATTLTLAPGDVAVLVSDGMLAAGDTWLQTELSRNWQRSAEEIARALLAGAKKRGASHVDDRTVAVAKLIPAGSTQGE